MNQPAPNIAPQEPYPNSHDFIDDQARRNPGSSNRITFYPDSWIDQPGAAREDINPNYGIRLDVRPPRTELVKFDGNPRMWPIFIASFQIQVHDTVTCDAVRLTHLRNCLSNEIQSHLGEALIDPALYMFALKELQRKYGNPQIVSQAFIAEPATIPR